MYANAIKLIKQFEGLRLRAYLCPAGVPTIGYGSTHYENGTCVRMGDVIPLARAEKMLTLYVEEVAKDLQESLHVSINVNKLDALIDFCYNFGMTKFNGSTLKRMVQNDIPVRDEFLKWVHVNGVVSDGLVKRRRAEVELYYRSIE